MRTQEVPSPTVCSPGTQGGFDGISDFLTIPLDVLFAFMTAFRVTVLSIGVVMDRRTGFLIEVEVDI